MWWVIYWWYRLILLGTSGLIKNINHTGWWKRKGLECQEESDMVKWAESEKTKKSLLPATLLGFPGGSDCKESACHAGDLGLIPGSERYPGEGNDIPLHYSWLRIPWTKEPGGLQSMGSRRVRHNWATNTFTFTSVTIKTKRLSGWMHIWMKIQIWPWEGLGLLRTLPRAKLAFRIKPHSRQRR